MNSSHFWNAYLSIPNSIDSSRLHRNEVVWIYHNIEYVFFLSHFRRCEKIMNVFFCGTIGERVKVYPGIFVFFFLFSTPFFSLPHKKDFHHTTVSIWTFVMARLFYPSLYSVLFVPIFNTCTPAHFVSRFHGSQVNLLFSIPKYMYSVPVYFYRYICRSWF